MKTMVFRRSSMLPHSCSCSVAPLGHYCDLASLKRGRIVAEHVLGTVVLPGMGSLQYVPALVGTVTCVGAGGSVQS